MAQEHINTGTPNGNDGEFLRDAFVKVENNTTELYNEVASNASNITTNSSDIVSHNDRITDNELNIQDLSDAQTGGLKSFKTLALLQAYATPNINDSYKVTNDPTASNNGYYHWVSGTTYEKDALPYGLSQTLDPLNTTEAPAQKAVADYTATLRGGTVVSGETKDVSGGKVFTALESKLNFEDVLDLLHKTENNILSLPFFDERFSKADSLKNFISEQNEFTTTAGSEGVLNDSSISFSATTKYTTADYLNVSGINSYYCFAYKNIEAGDNWLIGDDSNAGSQYIFLRSTTLTVTHIGFASNAYSLPVGFDRSLPFVIQFINKDGDNNTQVYINGEKLTITKSTTGRNLKKFNFIGLNDNGNLKSLRGDLFYYKISNSTPTNIDLNRDLTLLMSLMKNDDFTLIEDSFNSVNVILLAGQSNADGRGNYNDSLAYLNFGDSKRFLNNYQDCKDFNVINSSNPNYNFDLSYSLISKISKLNNYKTVILAKKASGGTSFSGGNWNKGDVLYNELLELILSIKRYCVTNNLTPNFNLIWSQGESDGDNTTEANAYQLALSTFLTDIISDSGISDLKVIIGRLSINQTAVPELATIRTAQDNVAALSSNYYLLDTDTYTVLGDNIHFDTNGLVEFGLDCYDIMKNNNLLK